MYSDEETKENADKKISQRIEDKIDEALLKSRRIFLCDAVDSNSAKEIIRKLWYLELTAPGKPILFVMDYAFGEQAFETFDELFKPYENEHPRPARCDFIVHLSKHFRERSLNELR